MKASALLACAAVAISFSSALACSKFRVFLAPCTAEDLGRRITKDEALDWVSTVDEESYNLIPGTLEDVATNTDKHFEFSLEAVCDICELPASDQCYLFADYLDCCEETSSSDKSPIPHASRVFCGRLGCTVPIGRKLLETGETILILCSGNECRGFSIDNDDAIEYRTEKCGESAEAIPTCGHK